jgi:hypothetical protein
MTENNTLDIQKAIAYYASLKKASQKYCNSDKGKEKRRSASATYYQKMKVIDPDFMQKQNDKSKERYQRKKQKAIDALLPEM